MQKLKKFIALYFNLSRKETNGFILLCILVLVFIFLPFIFQSVFSSESMLLQSDQEALDSLTTLLESVKEEPYNVNQKNDPKPNENTYSYSAFDPNHSSEEEMTRAGVPAFIAKRMVKFRSKGGVFRTKEDVKKMYGLSEAVYTKLYAFIELPDKDTAPKQFTSSPVPYQKKQAVPFDLNTVDSIRLLALKGIGPSFASRILKYRNKLQGFISMEQLKEVYGLDSIALQELNTYAFIDKTFIPKKVTINTSDETILLTHPYIGKKFAKIIAGYRQQHGNYTSVEELKNIRSISEQQYLKMVPYLTVE